MTTPTDCENANAKNGAMPHEIDWRPSAIEDVRRISVAGQHVLCEVDDQAQAVRVPAVVGQRQNTRTLR